MDDQNTKDSEKKANMSEKKYFADQDLKWQNSLLPFMKYSIIGFFIFFFGASFFQLYSLHDKMNYPIQLTLPALEMKNGTSEEFEKQKYQTLVLLEEYGLKRRYHQANVGLMMGSWIKYLGFMTGMMLTLCGAVFILGKINIDKSTVDIEAKSLGKFVVNSSSPGIFLATLGVVLITFAISHRTDVSVKDGSSFLKLLYIKDSNQGGTHQKFGEEINETTPNDTTQTELPEE
ncbi:MAG: hypothetical protein IPP71_07940 [Bacteroidetes bacterium]|nr:hypothetical protein [Bacteroidota bacterium]